MWDARKELRLSFVIFLISVIIGVVSQLLDPDFSRLVMGNRYVEMTLNNIENGNPMGVYDSESEGLMSFMIIKNNIGVSFMAFVSGLLTSFGTGFILLQNGVMLGAFQTFFAQHGLLWESALAIWLHGTIEISAIIVAGAAGIAIGFAVALIIFSGIREHIDLMEAPEGTKGTPIALITAGILAMAFMGFGGLV